MLVFFVAKVGAAAVIIAPLHSRIPRLLLQTSRVAGTRAAAYVFALLLTSGDAGVTVASVVGQTLGWAPHY